MKKFFLILFIVAPLLSQANTLNDKDGQGKFDPKPKIENPFTHSVSLQLQAGTQGLGADVRFGLLRRLSVRGGLSFIPVKANNVLTLPGFQSTNNATINFYNAHLLADFVPFKGMRGFRLVGGAAYLYRADGGLSITPTGTYTYGNTTVTGTDIGNLNMNVSWKGIAPYAGIGLFKSFPNRVFNVNLDLGTYYMTSPSTHIIGTGLLTDNSSLEPQFNNNLKDYRWLPVIQLNFNFKIK